MKPDLLLKDVIDPVRFVALCWPHITLYDKQRDILYSVRDNDETVVPAGNGLGKDFISAVVVIWWMCSRRPARVVTTSVKHDQLNDVLWGEIRRLLATSAVNLPLKYNHMHIKQVDDNGDPVPLCELVGQVVNKGESMLGRHLPKDMRRTLAVFDEASGIDDSVYETSDTWAHCKLIIGNPYPTTNFFYKAVKAGDLKAKGRKTYLYRKVIRIKAEDSPNVQYAMAEIRAGREPSGKILIPGVVDYDTYMKRRELWDKIRQCIGLDADFYQGAEVMLYPPEWLNVAERLARKWVVQSPSGSERRAKAIGVDPGEGGANTSLTAVDQYGVLAQINKKTPDTSKIDGLVINFAAEWDVPAENVLFDTGGGGKQIADRMRANGFMCETIPFGEACTPEPKRGLVTIKDRKLNRENQYAYKNRRAQMYGQLRDLLDPATNPNGGFAIPAEYEELRRQMTPLPLSYDGEGRLYLPPKHKKNPNSNEITIQDILGCSPDELDSLVLAVHRLLFKPRHRVLDAA